MIFIYRFFCGWNFIGCAPVTTGDLAEKRKFKDFFKSITRKPKLVWGIKELVWEKGGDHEQKGRK